MLRVSTRLLSFICLIFYPKLVSARVRLHSNLKLIGFWNLSSKDRMCRVIVGYLLAFVVKFSLDKNKLVSAASDVIRKAEHMALHTWFALIKFHGKSCKQQYSLFSARFLNWQKQFVPIDFKCCKMRTLKSSSI